MEGGHGNWGGPPRPWRLAAPGAAGAYNRDNGKSRRAGRESDGVEVLKTVGTTQPDPREGPLPYHTLEAEGKGR